MRSDKQIEASRRNGARSKGPVTEEGKTTSSRNAATHGLTADKLLVLSNESSEAFRLFESQCIEHYQAACPMESDLVLEIVAARWRLPRILGIETSIMEEKMVDLEEYFEEYCPNANDQERSAAAFKSLATGTALNALARYETRIRRSYEKAVSELRRMQSERKKEAEQNEPNKLVKPGQATQTASPFTEPQPSPARGSGAQIWIGQPRNEPKPLSPL